jgi:hypothetical protein
VIQAPIRGTLSPPAGPTYGNYSIAFDLSQSACFTGQGDFAPPSGIRLACWAALRQCVSGRIDAAGLGHRRSLSGGSIGKFSDCVNQTAVHFYQTDGTGFTLILASIALTDNPGSFAGMYASGVVKALASLLGCFLPRRDPALGMTSDSMTTVVRSIQATAHGFNSCSSSIYIQPGSLDLS